MSSASNTASSVLIILPGEGDFNAAAFVDTHRTAKAAGHYVVLATPGGAQPHADETALQSLGPDAATRVRGYLEECTLALLSPRALRTVDEASFADVMILGEPAVGEEIHRFAATRRAARRPLTVLGGQPATTAEPPDSTESTTPAAPDAPDADVVSLDAVRRSRTHTKE